MLQELPLEENKEDQTGFNLEQLKIELRDKTLRKLKMFDYRKEDERLNVNIFYFYSKILGLFNLDGQFQGQI